MNNVAMNLVATLMQNNFSSKSYSESKQGTSKSSFTTVLNQAKVNTNERPSDRNNNFDANGNHDDSIGKTIDKKANETVRNNTVRNETAQNKTRENLEKMNRKNPVQGKHEKVSEVTVSKDDKEVNEVETEEINVVEETKTTKTEKASQEGEEILAELSEAEMELVNEIAAQLNIEPDELANLMNQLQLTVLDLSNMENLKSVISEVLQVNEPLELLVTDGAMEKLQEVMKTLQGAMASDPELARKLAAISGNEVSAENEGQANKANIAEVANNFKGETGGQMNQEQTPEDKTMMQTSKGVEVSSLESNQTSSGFEGALNQVITQKSETIIMNGQIQTIHTEVTAKDVFDQIVTGMKVQVSETKSNIVLQLEPQNLGKIALSLITENGSLTGHFVAESQAAKEIIEANLAQLKNQLQSQGIDVNELKITVGNSESFFTGEHEKENAFDGQGFNKNNKRNKIGNINDILADKLSEEIDLFS